MSGTVETRQVFCKYLRSMNIFAEHDRRSFGREAQEKANISTSPLPPEGLTSSEPAPATTLMSVVNREGPSVRPRVPRNGTLLRVDMVLMAHNSAEAGPWLQDARHNAHLRPPGDPRATLHLDEERRGRVAPWSLEGDNPGGDSGCERSRDACGSEWSWGLNTRQEWDWGLNTHQDQKVTSSMSVNRIRNRQ